MMKILSEMSFFNVADGGHDGVGPLGDLENGGGHVSRPVILISKFMPAIRHKKRAIR